MGGDRERLPDDVPVVFGAQGTSPVDIHALLADDVPVLVLS
jgi:hypothetical protein